MLKNQKKINFQIYNDNKYISINEMLKEKNNFDDSTFNENINYKNRKLIFLFHKRSHSNDKLESNNDSNKSVIYRKHDRNEKDNIFTKNTNTL